MNSKEEEHSNIPLFQVHCKQMSNDSDEEDFSKNAKRVCLETISPLIYPHAAPLDISENYFTSCDNNNGHIHPNLEILKPGICPFLAPNNINSQTKHSKQSKRPRIQINQSNSGISYNTNSTKKGICNEKNSSMPHEEKEICCNSPLKHVLNVENSNYHYDLNSSKTICNTNCLHEKSIDLKCYDANTDKYSLPSVKMIEYNNSSLNNTSIATDSSCLLFQNCSSIGNNSQKNDNMELVLEHLNSHSNIPNSIGLSKPQQGSTHFNNFPKKQHNYSTNQCSLSETKAKDLFSSNNPNNIDQGEMSEKREIKKNLKDQHHYTTSQCSLLKTKAENLVSSNNHNNIDQAEMSEKKETKKNSSTSYKISCSSSTCLNMETNFDENSGFCSMKCCTKQYDEWHKMARDGEELPASAFKRSIPVRVKAFNECKYPNCSKVVESTAGMSGCCSLRCFLSFSRDLIQEWVQNNMNNMDGFEFNNV